MSSHFPVFLLTQKLAILIAAYLIQSPIYNGPTKWWTPHNFSALQWCESDMHSVETNYKFLSFPRLEKCGGYSLMILGIGSEPQVLVSHGIMKVPDSYSVFHFQYRIQ